MGPFGDDHIGRRPIYAIVRAGSKQYRVEPNQLIDMDRLRAEVGSQVELTDVLLVGGNGDVQVGAPTLEGVRVVAEVVEHGRDKKIVGFKYKAKTRYRRKWGHRQDYTRLAIRRIVTGPEEAVEEGVGEETKPQPEAKAKRTRRAIKREALVETAGTEQAAEAKPARRARARKVVAEEGPEAMKTDEKTESD